MFVTALRKGNGFSAGQAGGGAKKPKATSAHAVGDKKVASHGHAGLLASEFSEAIRAVTLFANQALVKTIHQSPIESPVADLSSSPYLELEALASPVPDLASTLTTTQAEQDANDANVSFLRIPVSQNDLLEIDPHSVRAQRRRMWAERESLFLEESDGESQQRIEATGAQNERRYTPSELQNLQERALAATQRSSSGYQGWAPTADSGGRNDSVQRSGLPTMSRTSSEFYDEQRRALVSFARHVRSSSRESSASGGRGSGSGSSHQTSESSLRTAALLQSARSRSHLSARSRDLMQHHFMEREHSGQLNDSRNQFSTSDARRRSGMGSRSGRQREQSPSTLSNTLHDQARRDWILTGYQRAQEEEQLQRQQERSKWHIEDAIKYLERLRFCDSYQDSVSSAAAGGFVREEFFTTNHDDFILDTAMIDPPADSSWLKVGGLFAGSQHATTACPYRASSRSNAAQGRRPNLPQIGQAQALPIVRNNDSHTQANPPSRPSGTHARTRIPLGTYENVDHAAQQFRTLPLNSAAERSLVQPSSAELSEERWPVQVKIHSVDFENMTLAGTMEAFNVPDKQSLSQVSSITTYLQGEIIDFNKFTLKTKNYKTDENTDSVYWRMLEPFKKLTEDEMVQGLLSKKWMKEQLREKYILMRWKVLTISGFYYVSLRRSDGRIEALYYDPSSAPFQHLSMKPEGKRYFPTYEFS
ncbi:MAG: hypothetical protein Q9220_001940 [cf. Caloplaca sp. 1 TL-2023]